MEQSPFLWILPLTWEGSVLQSHDICNMYELHAGQSCEGNQHPSEMYKFLRTGCSRMMHSQKWLAQCAIDVMADFMREGYAGCPRRPINPIIGLLVLYLSYIWVKKEFVLYFL